MDQNKTTRNTTIHVSTLGKERPTAAHVCHTWHDPVADVGVEQESTIKGAFQVCHTWNDPVTDVGVELGSVKKGAFQVCHTWNDPVTDVGVELVSSIKGAFQGCHTWHVPFADVGVERGSTIKGCCVWEKEKDSVRCEIDQIKQQRTTTINNLQGKTYCYTWTSHVTRPTCWCRRWTRKHH